MKKMNRREFLTLTGAAVVALSLAGCGGGGAPPPPPLPNRLSPAPPTGKEAELLAAINKVWKEKFVAGQVDHEQLTLNQDAVDAIRCYGRVFEEVNETPHKLTSSDFGIVLRESGGLAEKLKKYGGGGRFGGGGRTGAGAAGISEPSTEKVVALEDEYSCEDTAVRVFVDKLLNNSNSAKAEFISIYCPVVQGKTYMTAVVFWNKTA